MLVLWAKTNRIDDQRRQNTHSHRPHQHSHRRTTHRRVHAQQLGNDGVCPARPHFRLTSLSNLQHFMCPPFRLTSQTTKDFRVCPRTSVQVSECSLCTLWEIMFEWVGTCYDVSHCTSTHAWQSIVYHLVRYLGPIATTHSFVDYGWCM